MKLLSYLEPGFASFSVGITHAAQLKPKSTARIMSALFFFEIVSTEQPAR
jgi:hypothetical protein